MELKPIGIIHSPYKKKGDAPPQGRMKNDTFEIEVYPEFVEGLKDVDTLSHLIVFFWCDRSNREDKEILRINTPWDTKPHGVFATRSPNRPNPIAFDIAEMIEVKDNIIVVKGLDALDKSPLIDIKPYNPKTDSIPDAKMGWRENVNK